MGDVIKADFSCGSPFSEADHAAIVRGRRVQQIIDFYPGSPASSWPSARLVRQVERAIAGGDYDRFAKKHGLKRYPHGERLGPKPK